MYTWFKMSYVTAPSTCYSSKMKFPFPNLYLPVSDGRKESEGVGDGIASSRVCSEAKKNSDVKTIDVIGLDQRFGPPAVLPHLSSQRDSIGQHLGRSAGTQVMQTASVDVTQSKDAATILFWKKPSPRANRRAKVAAVHKPTSVSSKYFVLALEDVVSETHAEGTIPVVRGISYSDEDDDSDDDDLPDVDDFL